MAKILVYSARSAAIGCALVARYAGSAHAAMVTASWTSAVAK
ncbi:MAG: hypothetical protein ABIS06_01825 [Vicinamibacterales bacterium]